MSSTELNRLLWKKIVRSSVYFDTKKEQLSSGMYDLRPNRLLLEIH